MQSGSLSRRHWANVPPSSVLHEASQYLVLLKSNSLSSFGENLERQKPFGSELNRFSGHERRMALHVCLLHRVSQLEKEICVAMSRINENFMAPPSFPE
jgi:hypothetical protein